jgi:hypothetical protein
LSQLTTQEFDDATLVEFAGALSAKLLLGPGFAVIRGWPAHERPGSDLIFWGISSLLGPPQPQNLAGDRLHLVADRTLASPGDQAFGGSTGSNEILLHTENARPPSPPRIIGLLCLRQAAHGGASMLLSGHSLHNLLLDRYPDIMPRLYQDFEFGRHDEPYADGKTSDFAPVFREDKGSILVRYSRYWINIAEQASGRQLDAVSRYAADTVDQLLTAEGLALSFLLQPGDMLFVHNHSILHGRRSFHDQGDPRARRQLLRVWIS